MKKFVKYMGETKDGLIKGKSYRVESCYFHEEQISLVGFAGKTYDIKQFADVTEYYVQQKSTFIAFAKCMPEIGKESFLVRIESGNIQPMQISYMWDISYV